MDLFILKVGGSVCTYKEENLLKAREDIVRRVAEEIKSAREEREFNLIVVHGAGPFGHKLVSDYGINEGIKSAGDVRGFVRTHNSMEDLNKIFMDIFREVGLLGFPIQPSAFIIQKNKKIAKFDTEIIDNLLKMENVIPIMYGDMVIDKKLKASVISGDAIIALLAKKFKAKKVLMGTDVLGIFTTDPKRSPNAQLIPKIDSKNFKNILPTIIEPQTIDVTEGMRGKLKRLKENLKGIDIIIFDLKRSENLYRLLLDKMINCTKIRF